MREDERRLCSSHPRIRDSGRETGCASERREEEAGTLAARKSSVIRPSLLRSFASSAASASSVDVSAALVNSKLR